jgi:hypothetical protein
VSVKPQGQARYRYVDARGFEVSTLGPLHVVFSRKGKARKILGLVTDAPELSAAGLIQAYEKRWAIEQFVKDAKQLLGLGHYQNRSYRAAVIHPGMTWSPTSRRRTLARLFSLRCSGFASPESSRSQSTLLCRKPPLPGLY